MDELARIYWFPLYAYIRHKGNSPEHAEDLVQGFFARLLEKESLAAVDPAKGKFRSFLLASLQNYLANEWDKARAAKRGGGRALISLDAQDAESRYLTEPATNQTPERIFEKRWALAVLERVLQRLRAEYVAKGQAEVFAALEHLLTSSSKEGYFEIAGKLQMNEGAVRLAAHRLRQRYRSILRDEIGQTVAEPNMVDEEIRQLLECLQ
jgi:RNA polymerase sigma-70 factor (ECF subfamily)